MIDEHAHITIDLLTVRDAAAMLGVHPQTLRRWERKDAITSLRTPGNQRRYRRGDLLKLITERAS